MMMPKPSVAQPAASAEELRCPLCFEVFHEPRTLGCMHTFCADCLASLIIPTFSPNKPGALSRTEYLKFIECPLCRRNQELGPEGVDGLPRHHALANLALKYRTTMASIGSTDSTLDLLRSRTPSPIPQHRPRSPATEAFFEKRDGEAPDEGDEVEEGEGEEKEHVARHSSSLAAHKPPALSVQRLLVNHLRYRLRPDEVPGLTRTWLQSLSWVPAEFHRDVTVGDFTRHFIPFYQFDVHSRTEISWNSVFVFTDAFGSQQSLSVKHQQTVFALASAENLHTPHVEALVRWTDKVKNVILSKIPVGIPLDAELIWTEKASKEAKSAAEKYAESRIPPPYPMCRNENEVLETSFESYQPRIVVYPMYYGSYKYQERTYRVVVDGFTKEVAGEKPFGLKNRKWAGVFPVWK